MARCPVSQGQSIAGWCRCIEVAMGTTEPLVVVGSVQCICTVQRGADLAEGCVLVEATRERAGRCLDLRGDTWIARDKIRGKADESGSVIDGEGFVADLAFVVREVKNPVAADRSADRSSELLTAVRRLRNSPLLIDGVVGVQSRIQDVVVTVSVKVIGSAAGDRVHKSPTGLAE